MRTVGRADRGGPAAHPCPKFALTRTAIYDKFTGSRSSVRNVMLEV